MRLAWFSPMPPVPSGVADCSAELVNALNPKHTIDVYVHADRERHGPMAATAGAIRSAHDFVWAHRSAPYDLTIFQIGNSSHHDYIWPYLFRYPGLTVLHDVRLHHARAATLLRTRRQHDFRVEFAANHPDLQRDLAELAIAGFDNHLYYYWPMSKLIIQASRLTAVHSEALAQQLRQENPGSRVTSIRLGHGLPISDDRVRRARAVVRERYRIAPDDILFGVFGGLTPDKRVPQILDAFDAVRAFVPSVRLLLAGASARHYDVAADIRARRLEDRVTITGYLDTIDELTDCIAACDVSLNLRWPTAGEISGPWLRALAAGRPTITIDLAHLIHVPSLDPRTWRTNPPAIDSSPEAQAAGSEPPMATPDARATNPEANGGARTASREARGVRSEFCEAVTVAVDILDEDHSLGLAMRRLATDAELRGRLGRAGRAYWEREHSIPRMVADYERALEAAASVPPPSVALPQHLVNSGDRLLNEVLREFTLSPVWE